MKKKLIALLALLLCATLSHAFAETVVIGESDMYGARVGETLDADNLLEMTVLQTTVVDRWRSFPADSRNQYLIVPVDILNISFEDVDVGSQVSLKLAYMDYHFEAAAMRPTDVEAALSEPDILGTWTVHELISKSLTSFEATIAKDENGEYMLEWPKNSGKLKLYVSSENSYFSILGGSQYFIYHNGIISGMTNIWTRDNAEVNVPSLPNEANTLSMLEEATFEYVLKLPNIVIESLSDCYVEITVGEKDYTVHL